MRRVPGAIGRVDEAVDPGDFRQAAQLGLVVELEELVLGAVLRLIGHPAQQDMDHR